MDVINRVGEIRRRQGCSAAALAEKVGVTRQAIHAIESGAYAPNTTVALKMARELGVSVQDLFRLADGDESAQADAQLAGPETYAGAPLRLCRVDGRLVAAAWSPEAFALPTADAYALENSRSGKVTAALLHARAADDSRLLIAGCDPAVSVLAEHLRRSAGVELIAVPSSSQKALQQLDEGLVHLAGTHLSKNASRIPANCRVFTFAEWEEGFVVATGNPLAIRSFEDLGKPGVRIVNRERGAGSRALMDAGLAEAGIKHDAIEGFENIAAGHLAAAWAVNKGEADCCLAPRVAARVFGLSFVPLLSERYELVIPEQRLEIPAVQALLDVLQRSAFQRELQALGGYDITSTGEAA